MSPTSKIIIVIFSFIVALLHHVSVNYQGFMEVFIHSYLIDILLPMNIYLLLQLMLRKQYTVSNSRVVGAAFTFSFCAFVEFLQYNKVAIFGSIFDPLDLLMYASGVVLGLLSDFIILSKFEKE